MLARITPVATLAEALQGAALVQENVRETIEAKRAIFAEMGVFQLRNSRARRPQ